MKGKIICILIVTLLIATTTLPVVGMKNDCNIHVVDEMLGFEDKYPVFNANYGKQVNQGP